MRRIFGRLADFLTVLRGAPEKAIPLTDEFADSVFVMVPKPSEEGASLFDLADEYMSPLHRIRTLFLTKRMMEDRAFNPGAFYEQAYPETLAHAKIVSSPVPEMASHYSTENYHPDMRVVLHGFFDTLPEERAKISLVKITNYPTRGKSKESSRPQQYEIIKTCTVGDLLKETPAAEALTDFLKGMITHALVVRRRTLENMPKVSF